MKIAKKFRSSLTLIVSAGIMVSCSQQSFDLTPQTKDFAQDVKYNRQADVLIVMEASGAMDQQQRYTAIAAQMPALVKVLIAANLDFHIAVTTMTPRFQDPQTQTMIGQGGQFMSHGDGLPAVLSSAQLNLGAVLANRLTFNSTDFLSPANFGRLAVQKALSSPLLNGANSGFLRANASLNVIFISSKEDDVNNTTPVDLATFLNKLRPPLATGERSWYTHYVGVLSNATTDQCASAQWGYRSAGLKFMDVVTASGGTATTICSSDLTIAVQNIQARILEVVTHYYMSQVPNISTIKVYEAGVLVLQDPLNGWTYDSSIQSLVFHGASIPPDGTPFHVDYTPSSIQ